MVLSQNEWVNNIPSPLTGDGQGGSDYPLKKLTELGKVLRKRPTDAGQLLRKHLRMKQMEGLKFRRQQPVDKYIVDFVCFEMRLVIEIDGGQHAVQKEKDIEALAKLFVIPECFYPSPNDSIGDTSIRGRIWFFKQLEPDSRSESLRE